MVRIDWILSNHLDEICKIEKESFNDPWTKDDFFQTLHNETKNRGLAAFENNHVIGYLIYKSRLNQLQILNFAIQAKYRCQGVGTELLNELISKSKEQKKKYITIKICETELKSQLYLKNRSFKAVKVIKNYFENNLDAYYMKYIIQD